MYDPKLNLMDKLVKGVKKSCGIALVKLEETETKDVLKDFGLMKPKAYLRNKLIHIDE